MNKYLVFAILLFFLVYTVAGIFINIPKNINNFLMILVSIGAIYFIIFKTDFRENFKKNMKEKSEEIKRSKAEKVKLSCREHLIFFIITFSMRKFKICDC